LKDAIDLLFTFKAAMIQDLNFSLATLIDPVPGSTFFREYWEEKPLLVTRKCQDYYASLLSLEQFDSLITATELAPSGIDVVNADTPVDRSEFVRADGSIDILKIYQLFSSGATVLLQELQRRHAPLASLCRALEVELSIPFQTNVYLTPAHGKGFRPHYDTHDVFLLQISGSKEWTIRGSPVPLPLRGQPFDSNVHPIGDTLMSLELRAGDVLYIPRGFLHHARSRDEISLHITLGALSHTWADLLLEVMSDLWLSDPAFRRALPVGFACSEFDVTSARSTFMELLQRTVENASFETALERLADELVATRRPFVPGLLKQISLVGNLSDKDEVGARPGLLYRLRTDGGAVRIRCHGREVSIPIEATEAVKFALENVRYIVRDLPGRLDAAGKVVLVRRLIEEGMVVRYSNARPA